MWRSWIARLFRRIVPARYRGGRLDRFTVEDQKTIMANRFRSGI